MKKEDKTLIGLLEEIRTAVVQKDNAERARVHAEERKRKAHINYTLLMDIFRNREYIIK